ncbi:bifunctional 1-(5-phosphoribosyl)-5-((5-phosphoribosylamino)methylideneamino)imidazole-4-carboxamide isomerase/phosphoribosylanthranilate isomerase PriA [Acidipropionibacterium jensenii]|uniref:1-(5-phosphoribosyl)-5-[(5-phosphoribosylamino)methylideneamino] imidazole-4-carboxamide isomerase n=1 Tax=Acidipropionibacterium jensenii TaxID=1749 RepID=A0A3S4V0T5_9ACTN|nr:bifunctional 1-(5-phosphoribosyl)-5-((5-phosphoribosylamino)methylideneamino)imidazole-4-carboxamide isomerase/phosphoribosylanthranilate isomerase PriA [Acidipropionibacterium jensenii]AZZ39496.1 bifunctional 1-(5-phosphoribosyl)-5-((5-phosphoribosylamino)methylideneamino)imidazole-4-carboxamide isomerase/phosphoribosylanthranilate isomerase PriA [Acidipropionibacterium jensenii]MDN5977493.1 bifunctional 1-(5-phosphoribosyl)-5-((5-phosphoribosylamino)methylideneamino)imidazole-4-carboxamide i
MTEELILLPAVDVQDGQAVQLQQGVAGTQKVFGDPLEAARRWQTQGAQWIHLVDLDAAFGRGSNTELIRRVVGEMGINVEVSGGIRDQASLDAALAAGASRVNIGTAALENPQWCDEAVAQFGDRVAIGLDVRGDRLAARGWTQEGGRLLEVLARLEEAGCRRYVVTDVNSDGMLTGPNYELLGQVCARTQGKVVASGGISTLEDLRRLRGLVPIGVEGAIVGTALYLGNFTLPDAMTVCRGQSARV